MTQTIIGTKPENAELLLEHVSQNPGVTRLQLSESLRIPLVEVGRCIRWLEQHELIIREEE